MNAQVGQRVSGEFLGTMFLVASVVGSGIMGERLSEGNAALALLINTIATGAALVALILALAPISGAHLNPVVSMAFAIGGKFPWHELPFYAIAQIAGGFAGTVIANLMFRLPPISLSHHNRSGLALAFGEFVATFGLVAVIWCAARFRPSAVAYAAGAYITAAYWFTASTSFANPAVTIARMFSDTFAGIRPSDVPWFILAQIAAGIAAALMLRNLGQSEATKA
ncbi:MAG: MIP/aquaporin family protein [Candidatus Acidiferrales bacterium]